MQKPSGIDAALFFHEEKFPGIEEKLSSVSAPIRPAMIACLMDCDYTAPIGLTCRDYHDMTEFNHYSVILDVTLKGVETSALPPDLAQAMVNELRRRLLAENDGRTFAINCTFPGGRTASMEVRRIGDSACVTRWSRHEQLLAITLILSGLDAADDSRALQVVMKDWGILLPPALWDNWDEILEHQRPVIVDMSLAPGSYSDVVIRGGNDCLEAAFAYLVGMGDEE